MAIYQRGSTGPEVRRVQDRLREMGRYHGPPDGIYGGGTESAVRAFQRAEDVRTRKLTIATGRGTVHGRRYDLEQEYGIRLTEAV